jgi:hypothetical protein
MRVFSAPTSPPSRPPSPPPATTYDVWRARNCDSAPASAASALSATSSSTPPQASQRAAARESVSTGGGNTLDDAAELSMLDDGPAEPWFVALVLVGFDIDKGQVVESCVPEYALTASEKDTVCFYSMPDSAAGGGGREDAVFSFRVLRHNHGSPASSPAPAGDATAAAQGRASRVPCGISSQRLLLAHSLFRQAPDPSSPRGSFQKALVLVTSTPYLTLPHMVLSSLADEAFVHGHSALERAIGDASGWPNPRVQTSSRALTLRILGAEIAVSLPDTFLGSFAAPQAAVRLVPAPDAEDASQELDGRSVAQRLVDESSPVSSGDDGEATDDIPAVDLQRHRDVAGRNGEDAVAACRSAQRPHRNGQRAQAVALRRFPGASPADLVRCWPLTLPSSNPTAPPFHEVDVMRALSGAHDRVWALWELVALGEPLAVFAPTPSQASAAVLAVISLIHPLPFVGDWRPYFCIQDPDYPRLAHATSIRDALPRGAVFGITNSHVLETLKFAHVLTITGPGDRGVNVSYRSGFKSSNRSSIHRSRQLSAAMNAAIAAQGKRDGNTMAAAAFDVRACLLDRVTRPFLRAFDRYLVPTWGDGRSLAEEPFVSDPFGRTVQLVNLDVEAFPTHEDLTAPGVLALFKVGAVSKTRARQFYSRFVRGPVFKAWWRAAQSSAERECALVRRKCVLEACAQGVGAASREGQLHACAREGGATRGNEVVELCLRIRAEISVWPPSDKLVHERLRSVLKHTSSGLPPELMESVGTMDARNCVDAQDAS